MSKGKVYGNLNVFITGCREILHTKSMSVTVMQQSCKTIIYMCMVVVFFAAYPPPSHGTHCALCYQVSCPHQSVCPVFCIACTCTRCSTVLLFNYISLILILADDNSLQLRSVPVNLQIMVESILSAKIAERSWMSGVLQEHVTGNRRHYLLLPCRNGLSFSYL